MSKNKIGDVFQIDLSDGRLVFGRVLPNTWAFYDYVISSDDELDIEKVVSSIIVFKIWVSEFALEKNIWKIVGNIPLDENLKGTVEFYKQDPINNKVWKTLTGAEEIPTSIEECLELEVAAVWDPEHVLERLDCLFTGKIDDDLLFDKKALQNKGIPTL